ncbi:MAG: quinone oxidoreductase family protein [Tepidisphaeraceae bacterium]
MRAWLLDKIGDGIEKMRFTDAPDPEPGPGEVVLDVEYAALNPADRYLAEGQYPGKPALPHILGRDGVGTVRGIGPGVTGLSVGQKKVVLRGDAGITRPGTFAEKVSIPVESLVDVPEGWTDEESSGATLVYLTAYQAISQWEDLPKPATVLVTGASGGVGVACVQLARALGHTVLGLSRDKQKSRKLVELGTQAVFDPTDPNWRKLVKDHLEKRRVDLAIDNIGGTLLPEVIDTLADHGRVSCVGRLAGPVPNFNTGTLFFRRIRLGGVAVHAYTNAESRAAWPVILELLRKTGSKPLVDSIFTLANLPDAFERLRCGPMGKVLLQSRQP